MIQVTDTEYIAPEGYAMTQSADVEPCDRVFCLRRIVLPDDTPEDWRLITVAEAAEMQESINEQLREPWLR